MISKKQRIPNDFYPTPVSVIEHFFDIYGYPKNMTILEPSAGNGNFINVIRQHDPTTTNTIDAIEIREEEKENLLACADNVSIESFLSADLPRNKYDLVIGNPPFMYALEFVEKSLDIVKPDGKVIFLLRTAFLESKRRFDFWQKNKLTGLYTLSERPKFVGDSTDRTAYSWFVWDKASDRQIIEVI